VRAEAVVTRISNNKLAVAIKLDNGEEVIHKESLKTDMAAYDLSDT
jgi:hypothetical protein